MLLITEDEVDEVVVVFQKKIASRLEDKDRELDWVGEVVSKAVLLFTEDEVDEVVVVFQKKPIHDSKMRTKNLIC